MNWNDYKRAMDALPLSGDFQERTQELVRQQAQKEKERITMRKKAFARAMATAAAVALFTVSAYAASRWPSPSQVAQLHGDPALAQAFESGDAIKLNQTVETGDLAVTLAGLVSGEDLSSWNSQADQARTYAMIILESLNGTPLDADSFPLGEYTLTPLVAGFTPWSVNNWTLDADVSLLEQDGILYYLLDVQSIEMFADHTVYLAFYQGTVPSRDTFTMAENGTIAFAGDFEGPHALFTLPLDRSKADPAAVERFMDGSGFDRDWFTTVGPDDGMEYNVRETETEDGGHIEISPKSGEETSGKELNWLTVDEFAAYVDEELADMARQVKEGRLSQANCDREAKELAEQLEAVQNGCARAARLENGGMPVVLFPSAEALENAKNFSIQETEDGVSISIQ